MSMITNYPTSGFVSETITTNGLSSTTLSPLMPKDAHPVPNTPYWLLSNGDVVKPVMNNRASVRAMKNGK